MLTTPPRSNPTWIHRRAADEIARSVDDSLARAANGEDLPLAGLTFAVKDNIDVAGVPTTAGCPSFATTPPRNATVVQRLVEAGATFVGKTNMDQFATGLVGTRSPYGAVHASGMPERIAGGSSSGSAVVVADGEVDFALGTDTAGSGRVPAAFNGIVGLKPSPGLVPATGVVPACADFDCVSVFARTVPEATRVMAVIAGPDGADPRCSPRRDDVALAAPSGAVLAVPRERDLSALGAEYREAFDHAVRDLKRSGVEIVTVDISPLLDAARLLYDSALVAERYAAVGDAVSRGSEDLDPTVAAIILGGRDAGAVEFVGDLECLAHAGAHARRLMTGIDGLLLPTTTDHPTLAEVAAAPFEVNRRLGTFTNFCNLLDMCGVAVPGQSIGPGRFGVMVLALRDHDQVAADLAARVHSTLLGTSAAEDRGPVPEIWPGSDTRLAVFGAHLRGQPLHHQLESLGARFVGDIRTSADYRLFSLPTVPPKPGLVPARPEETGRSINGELYRLPHSALGRLLAELPAPMSLTRVSLDGGESVVGFGCTADALGGAEDITDHTDWRLYLATTSTTLDTGKDDARC